MECNIYSTCNIDEIQPILNDNDSEVTEAIRRLELPECRDVEIEFRDIDKEEERVTAEFARTGCSCKMGKGGTPCCLIFTKEYYDHHRSQCFELSKNELDLVILGQMTAAENSSPIVLNSTAHRHPLKERERNYMNFFHKGHRICRNTFLFLHTIKIKRFRALSTHYRANGLVPRTHGLAGKSANSAFNLAETEFIIKFIVNYAQIHGILLPGRVPGYKRSDIQILPCNTTKLHVWRLYKLGHIYWRN